MKDRSVRTEGSYGAAMVRRVAAAMVVLGLSAVACAQPARFSAGDQGAVDLAVELLESDELAQRLGLDVLSEAQCDDPPGTEVGTVFGCVAHSVQGSVRFLVTVEADDSVFAGPTNVVDAQDVSGYASSSVRVLNAANDLQLAEEDLDCGDTSVVLDDSMQMVCVLTVAGSDTALETIVTITDLDLGTFEVEVSGIAEAMEP